MIPAGDSVFSGWTECDRVSGTTCTVSGVADRTVTVTFEVPDHTHPRGPPRPTPLLPGRDDAPDREADSREERHHCGRLRGRPSPDTSLVSLQLGGRIVPGFILIVTRVVPFPFTGELLRYVVTGQEPAGSYTWFSGLATPGTLELMGPVSETPFTLSR